MRKAPVALLPLAEETQPPVERPLSGKRVAFTGFTDPGAASECRSLVEALGGGAQSAVTKRTSVLVAAKGLTKKRLAAQQHGIPVVSTQWLRLGAEAPHEQFPVPWLVGYRLCLAMLEDDQREALTAVLRLHGAAIVPADAADTDAVLVGSEFARHLRGLPRRHRILPRRAASQEPAGRDRSVSLSVPRDTSMLGGAPVLDFAVFLRLARLSQEGDEDALLSAAGVRDRSDFDTIVAAGRIQPKSEAPAAPPRTLPAAALPGGLDGSASSSACSSSADDDDATLYVADGLTESAATPDYYESAGPEVEPPGLLGGQINVFYQAQKRAAAGDTQGQQQGPGRAIATLGARCDEGALFLAPPPEAWVPALAPATGPFLVVALLGHRGDELGAAMRCCAACRFLLVTCATRVADVIVLGSQLVQRKRTSAAKRRLRQLRDAGAAAVCWYEAHPEVAELAAECLGAHRSRIAPLAWLRECGARAQAAHRGGPLDPAVETAGEGGDSAPVVAPKESRAGARGGGFCLADAPPLGRGAFRIRFRAPQPQVATATATAPPSQLSSSGAPPVAGAIKEGGSAPATGSAAPLAVAASQPPPAAPRANYQEERQQAQSRLDGCLRLVRHAAVLPSQGERQCCVVAPAAALSDAARRVFRRGYFCLVEGDYARVEASVVRGLVGLGGGRWLKLKAAEWRGWLRSLSRSGRATTDETPPAAGAEARAFLDVVQAEMAERRRRRKERRSVCQMPSSALSTSPSPCGTPSESATRSGRPFVLQLVSHHYQRQPVSGQQPAEQRAKPIPYLQQATSDYVLCCMAAEALVPVNSLFLFHTPLPSAVELALRRHRCTNASQAQSSFSSPPTDSAAAPRLSTWVWQRRYEKPGAVGVSVSFVYRVPPSLMEVPGATDTAVAPAASLTQCSPSPRGLAIIKVLLLALHHAVQALGGSVQDAFRPDAVTHVILVDVAAVCPEDGDCGAQWPAADVHSIRSAPPGTVCLVTPRWLEDSVRWGAFIEEGDDSAYAWSLEYPPPILSPQMPAGGRGRTVSPAPRSLPLFDAAAAQRRSLSQRCTSVARRLREQLSPRQPGPPSASACRPAISTPPRTDSSPTAQRFDFETPGKAPRQAPTRPAERKHQLLGTDDGEADPRRSPAPQSQSGLQIDPQSQSGLQIDPQFQSGLPIDPQSQSGLQIDPQSQSGLQIDPQSQSGLQIDPQSQSGLQIDPQSQSGLQIDPQFQSGLQIDPQSQSGLPIDPQSQSGLQIDPQSQSGLQIDPQSQSGLPIDPSSALRSRDRKRQRSATPPPLQLVGRLLPPSPQPAPPPPPPAGLYQAPHPVEAPVCRCYILHDVPGRGAFLGAFEAVRRSGSAPVPAPGDVRVELADTAVGAAVVVTHEMRPRASLLAAVAAGAWMVTPAFLGDLSEALRRGGSLALQRDALDDMRGRHDWAVVAQLDDGRAGLPPATRLFLRRAAHYRAQRAVYGAAPFDGKTFVLWKGAAARRGAGDSQLEGVAQVISSGGGSVLCVVRAECGEEQAPAARMRICRPYGGGGDGAPLVVLPASAALESFLLFVIAFAAQRSAERTAPTGGQADPHHEVYLLFDGQLLESPVPIPAPRSTGGVTWRAWLQGLDFLEDGNDGGAMRLREAVERPPAEPWAEGALLALRSVVPCPPGRGGPPATSKASHLRFTLATAEMRWVMDLLLSDGAGSSSASQSSQRRAGKNRHLLLTQRSLHIPVQSFV